MVTAVIAAPVPPPTMAAMPIMAPVVAVTPSSGCNAVSRPPKAPPIDAPMNSEGEKIPPEAPQPRLIEVAHSLATNSIASSAGSASSPWRSA
jgi:hypothetical protein